MNKAEQEWLNSKIGELRAKVDDMKEDVMFLQCLRQAGVDNWEGYDQATGFMLEQTKEAT